jgi:hypothetical protein
VSTSSTLIVLFWEALLQLSCYSENYWVVLKNVHLTGQYFELYLYCSLAKSQIPFELHWVRMMNCRKEPVIETEPKKNRIDRIRTKCNVRMNRKPELQYEWMQELQYTLQYDALYKNQLNKSLTEIFAKHRNCIPCNFIAHLQRNSAHWKWYTLLLTCKKPKTMTQALESNKDTTRRYSPQRVLMCNSCPHPPNQTSFFLVDWGLMNQISKRYNNNETKGNRPQHKTHHTGQGKGS